MPRKIEDTLGLTPRCLGMIGCFRSRPTPYINEVMRSLELKVYGPDLTEFVAHGESPHCLTFELERDKEQFGELLLEVGQRLRNEVKQCW